MEQEIQYCTSADGTRIAFSVVGGGSGVPLVYAMPPPWTSVADIARSWLVTDSEVSQLWAKRVVCFVNPRGCGMSDRDATDFDLERLTDDLEAAIERTGWSRFSLAAMGMSGPIAILYRSRHPEKVARLILRDTYLRAADMGKIPRMRALGAVLRADYESYLDLMALTILGWDDAEQAKEMVTWMADVSSHEAVQALANATATFNVTGLTEAIAVPTLVMNPNYMPVPSSDMARALVAMIADARLWLYGRNDGLAIVDRMAEFLAEGDDALDAPNAPSGINTQPGLTVILFADIANSTGLTEELGDAAFREKARSLDIALRDAISGAGGTAIEGKLLGDGVLATFGAAREGAHARHSAS